MLWFCVVVGCCQLFSQFSLRLCVSVLFLVGLDWSRCGFLLVCAGLAAFAWFCVVLGCCQLLSLRLCALCGSGLVSAGLAVFVLFCVNLGWSRLVSAALAAFASRYLKGPCSVQAKALKTAFEN